MPKQWRRGTANSKINPLLCDDLSHTKLLRGLTDYAITYLDIERAERVTGPTWVTAERRRLCLWLYHITAECFTFYNVRHQNANHPIHPPGMLLKVIIDTRSLHRIAS